MRRPSVDAAIALCERLRISLDWLHLGDDSNLTHKVRTIIYHFLDDEYAA